MLKVSDHNIILPKYLKKVKQKGSSLLLPAYGWVGQGQHSLAAHFAKRNTKNCGGEKRSGESEGGQKFLSPQPPFLPAPPERKSFLEINVRIFVKKSSDFIQKVPPIYNFSVFWGCCLALATLGLGRNEDFIRIFEIQKQFLPAQTEVRRAKHG